MKKYLFLFLAILSILETQATFEKIGNVITQKNVNNNLDDLAGIPGVNVQILRADQDDNGFKVYDLGNIRLIIEGTLTIDPDKETLLIGAPTDSTDPPLLIKGSLLYGIQKTNLTRGSTGYSAGTGLIITAQGASISSASSIVVDEEGEIIMNGGVIRISGAFKFKDGATFTQNSGTIYSANTAHASQIRIEATTENNSNKIELNNLTIDGLDYGMSLFTKNSFGKAVVNFKRGLFQTFSDPQPNLTLLNFNNSNNLGGIDFTYNAFNASGTAAITVLNAAKKLTKAALVTNNRYGYLKTERALMLKFEEVTGDVINKVSYYGKDFNNNSRNIGPGNHDDTADKIYEATEATVPVSFNVLVEAFIGTNSGEIEDDRTNTQGTIPISVVGYNYDIATIKPVLFGLGTNEINTTLLPDASITEQDQTITTAYTEINTSEKLYDYAKLYMVNNYKGELNTLITREEHSIDLNGYNLNIDPNAGAIFSIVDNTITIRTATFYGNLITTGVITVDSASFIEGTYQDANDINKYLSLNWNDSTIERITVIDMDTGSEILGPTDEMSSYKNHFKLPRLLGTNNIKVIISSIKDNTEYYSEELSDNEATSVNLNVILRKLTSITNELRIITISERLIAQVAAINNSFKEDVNAITNISIDLDLTTNTNAILEGSLENQEAILQLLRQLLKKVTTTRAALQNN